LLKKDKVEEEKQKKKEVEFMENRGPLSMFIGYVMPGRL